MLNVFGAAHLQVYHEGIASVQSMYDWLVRAMIRVRNETGSFSVSGGERVVTTGVGGRCGSA